MGRPSGWASRETRTPAPISRPRCMRLRSTTTMRAYRFHRPPPGRVGTYTPHMIRSLVFALPVRRVDRGARAISVALDPARRAVHGRQRRRSRRTQSRPARPALSQRANHRRDEPARRFRRDRHARRPQCGAGRLPPAALAHRIAGDPAGDRSKDALRLERFHFPFGAGDQSLRLRGERRCAVRVDEGPHRRDPQAPGQAQFRDGG